MGARLRASGLGVEQGCEDQRRRSTWHGLTCCALWLDHHQLRHVDMPEWESDGSRDLRGLKWEQHGGWSSSCGAVRPVHRR